jgi:hypothetical protein
MPVRPPSPGIACLLALSGSFALTSACAPHLFAERSADCDRAVRIQAEDPVSVTWVDGDDACSVRTDAHVRPVEEDDGTLFLEDPSQVVVTGAQSLEVDFDSSFQLVVESDGPAWPALQHHGLVELDGSGVFRLDADGGVELESCTDCSGDVAFARELVLSASGGEDLSICATGGSLHLDDTKVDLWSAGGGRWALTGDGTVIAYTTPNVSFDNDGVTLDQNVSDGTPIECGTTFDGSSPPTPPPLPEGDTDTDADADTDTDTDTDSDVDCDVSAVEVKPSGSNVDVRSVIEITHPSTLVVEWVDLYSVNAADSVEGVLSPGPGITLFAPDDHLEPAEPHEGMVYFSDDAQTCATPFWFQTSQLGGAVDNPAGLEGFAYQLEPIAPPQPVIGPFDPLVGFAFQIVELLADDAIVRFGVVSPVDGQNYCVDTLEASATFDDPWLTAELEPEGYRAGPARLLFLDGAFTTDGQSFQGGTALVEFDLRLAALDEVQACNQLAAFGDPCHACFTDMAEWCITTTVDVEAQRTLTPIEPVVPGDADCDWDSGDTGYTP